VDNDIFVRHVGTTLVADETCEVTVIVLSCHCCFISKAKSGYLFLISVIGACILWVTGIAVSMDAASYFIQKPTNAHVYH